MLTVDSVPEPLPKQLRSPTYRPGEAVTTDSRHTFYAKDRAGRVLLTCDWNGTTVLYTRFTPDETDRLIAALAHASHAARRLGK